MRIDRVKLVAAMAKAEINVKTLSQKTGVSRPTITSIKAGKSCSEETGNKLIAVLGNDILAD